MKIILIVGCSTCPYGSLWSLDGEYVCGKTQKINASPEKPLDTCPLDDAYETIKEIVSNNKSK